MNVLARVRTRKPRRYTREQIHQALESLVRKGLQIKRWEPKRGMVYVSIQFATKEELAAARIVKVGNHYTKY